MRRPRYKTCDACGARYEAKRRDQRFCGRKCRAKRQRKMKISTCVLCSRSFEKVAPAKYCGACNRRRRARWLWTECECERCDRLFERLWAQGYPLPVFCSRKCQHASRAFPIKKCESCGQEFASYQNPRSRPTRFCSMGCSRAMARESKKSACAERACKFCGSPFKRRASSSRAPKYCSRDCYYAAQRIQARDWTDQYVSQAREALKVLPIRKCENCGEPFARYRSPASRAPRFCSKRCWTTSLLRSRRSARADRACEGCGAIFARYANPRRQAPRYCSRKCAKGHRDRVRREEQNVRERIEERA